ncbi:conserved Plasmodium protein, unknown function [Plasmodium malariae]|uniref:Uncharacterized protein n=1 Tax=Plasmodium malariae TaxID=5858 RepID=A0A1A8W274_PLAMA|nr:conserved Plasmodium protein, unknown function [Plasmodium malariae]
MYFNGNCKYVHNSGLIFTTIEKIHIDDIKNVREQNEGIFDYLGYLNTKKKCLKKLEKLVNSHIPNSQIVLTNFADESTELLSSNYIYEKIVKKKTSFLLKNVYISSFFTNDYINYINKKYKHVLITLNCKYDNKVYINNHSAYFSINDLIKLRLIIHKNLYKDKYMMNNIVMIEIDKSRNEMIHDEDTRRKDQKEDSSVNPLNDIASEKNYNICENTTGNKCKSYEMIEKKNINICDKRDNNYTGVNKNKLRERYENFFSELYTHPVDVLGIFNTDVNYEDFSIILRNILANNMSRNVEVKAVHLRCYECEYKTSRSIASCVYVPNEIGFNTPNENCFNDLTNNSKSYDITRSQINTSPNEINIMNNALDIYKNIFSNSTLGDNLPNFDHPKSEINNYNIHTDIYPLQNQYDLLCYNTASLNNKHMLIASNINTNGNKEEQDFYELDINYIEKEFLSRVCQSDKKRSEREKMDDMCKHPNGDIIDVYDLKERQIYGVCENEEKADVEIVDKKFYLNYSSTSSSDVSLSLIRHVDNSTTVRKIEKEPHVLGSSSVPILGNFVKVINYKQSNGLSGNANEEREGGIHKMWENKKEKSFISKSVKREDKKKKKEKNLSLEKDYDSEEDRKVKKINKVASFIQKHKEYYFKNNENLIKRESLYTIMHNISERKETKKKKSHNSESSQKFDEFVNYLIDYIGRIHLDIKIDYKKNSNILVKKPKKYYQIQKIILNNGLIDTCNIAYIFNFLIDTLIKNKIENRKKLHYVLSISGKDYNFINSDKYSHERCTQVATHILFFSSHDAIYVLVLDAVNRVS